MKRFFIVAFSLLLVILSGCMQIKDERVISVSAEKMWNEFEIDRDEADRTYDDAFLYLSGSVAEISDSFMGSPCVLLENGVVSIPDGIFCMFPESSLEQVQALEVGQQVTIYGRCSIGIHIAGDDTPFIYIMDAELVEQVPAAD